MRCRARQPLNPWAAVLCMDLRSLVLHARCRAMHFGSSAAVIRRNARNREDQHGIFFHHHAQDLAEPRLSLAAGSATIIGALCHLSQRCYAAATLLRACLLAASCRQSDAEHSCPRFSGCRARQRMALAVLARAWHPACHAGPRGSAWMCRGCQRSVGVCHAGPRILYPHAAPGPAHHTPLPGWPQQSIQDALLGPATCGGMHGGARQTGCPG